MQERVPPARLARLSPCGACAEQSGESNFSDQRRGTHHASEVMLNSDSFNVFRKARFTSHAATLRRTHVEALSS